MTVTSITSRRARKAQPGNVAIGSDRSFNPAKAMGGGPSQPSGMSFQQLAGHLETCGQFAQVLVQGLGRCCYRAHRSLRFRRPLVAGQPGAIGPVCSLRDALYLDQDLWRLTVEIEPEIESEIEPEIEQSSGETVASGLPVRLAPVVLSIVFKPIAAQQFVVSLAGMRERFIVRLGRPEDFQLFYEMAFQRLQGVRLAATSPARRDWQVIESPSGG
jgi:hypothetical protein